MDMVLFAIVFPVLAITPSTILLIAGAVCFVAALVLWMKKKPSKAPDRTKEVSQDLDYAVAAAAVLAGVGGKENVTSVDCCADRLRFAVRDYTAINDKAVKSAGAEGVVRPTKNTCQVILGPKAQFVYDELKKML